MSPVVIRIDGIRFHFFAKLLGLARQHRDEFEDAWDEFFGKGGQV